jgi:hypothetical protein
LDELACIWRITVDHSRVTQPPERRGVSTIKRVQFRIKLTSPTARRVRIRVADVSDLMSTGQILSHLSRHGGSSASNSDHHATFLQHSDAIGLLSEMGGFENDP